MPKNAFDRRQKVKRALSKKQPTPRKSLPKERRIPKIADFDSESFS